MKIDFVIPVYNEDKIFEANAGLIIDYLKSADFDFNWRLIFAVNGSSVKFKNMVEMFCRNNPGHSSFFVIKKRGKGGAIKKSFDMSGADILSYMDVDLAVSLDNIPDLLDPIIGSGADLCFGSRMLPGSSRQRAWFRELTSKFYIFLSQIILVHDFSDLQCGFKAIKKSAWEEISGKIKNEEWFFDTELIYYAKKNGYKIAEVPISWSENRYHSRQSKVRVFRDGLIFIKELIKLKLAG